MYVGKGGFIQGDKLQTMKRLEFAATRLGLPKPTVVNPGTSWIGYGRLMILLARLQSEVIRWLHRFEFVEFERCCAGMTGWPNWHYHVLTLYAGYIAFNLIGPVGLQRIVMDIHEGTAGRGKWPGDDMMASNIRHAHVLHGRGVFSKHDLADGLYDDKNLRLLDPRLLPQYCLLVVMQSIRMTDSLLKHLWESPELLSTQNKDIIALDLPSHSSITEIPAQYDHTKENLTACWDTYWERWLPLDCSSPKHSYKRGEQGECVLTEEGTQKNGRA
eukprot:m.76603 g.76603  ORF g.76603 m.76603 type:complete len:273 (-) comp12567_c0_seq4:65-883(-)